MKIHFLDSKAQEIINENNYPEKEADKIIAYSPDSIADDPGDVFAWLCDNINKEIEFIKTPYLNTSNLRRITNSFANTENINLSSMIVDEFLEALYSTKEGDSVVKRHIVLKARAEGKVAGVAKGSKLSTKKSREMKLKIKEKSKFFDGDMNNNQLRKELGISINTLKKYIKEMKILNH